MTKIYLTVVALMLGCSLETGATLFGYCTAGGGGM
jgi:hypothetical protein